MAKHRITGGGAFGYAYDATRQLRVAPTHFAKRKPTSRNALRTSVGAGAFDHIEEQRQCGFRFSKTMGINAASQRTAEDQTRRAISAITLMTTSVK